MDQRKITEGQLDPGARRTRTGRPSSSVVSRTARKMGELALDAEVVFGSMVETQTMSLAHKEQTRQWLSDLKSQLERILIELAEATDDS